MTLPSPEFMEQEAEQLWLRGFKVTQIGKELGVTVRRVNQLLAPARKLMNEGGYTRELAELAAQGFTNLPASTRQGPGRPRQKLTADQRAMRAAFQSGKYIAEIARQFKTYPQKVRWVLGKSPTLL